MPRRRKRRFDVRAGSYGAAELRSKGLTVNLEPGKPVWLAVTGTGPLYDDRLGPYVDVTDPFLAFQRSGRISGTVVWKPIQGRYTLKADAADRSGVAKVEFYLNNGQLIGTDTEAPYECTATPRSTACGSRL